MKKLIRTFKQISILFLAIAFLGCEEDDAALPKVVANFTYTLDADTGVVTFINTSEKANTYMWNFGDNTTSSEINPVKKYATGTYTVSLKAKNVSGSSDTFEDTITINIPLPLSLPITFDVANVSYTAAVFNGASFEIVDNPSATGTNNKASKVGAITNSGAAYEGINFDVETQVDLTTNKSIKMNFWANAATTVLLKLEEGTGAAIETTVSHGGTGWEELIFNFNSSDKYSRLTIFVDGPGTSQGTFYIDDIEQIETPAPPCTPEDAENINPANGDINWTFKTNDLTHTFEAFGNTTGSIVTNPVFDGINTSCNVEKFVKSTGCETFAGLGKELATALDFTTISNKVFKMKVLAETQLTDVTLRLERLPFPNTDPAIERVASITELGVWQELTFDFSDVSTGTYKSMIIYFERNANCDGDVYYFDDIMQVGGGSGGGSTCTPDGAQSLTSANFNLTFESNPAGIIPDGATLTTIANPDFNNTVNSSCQVGKIVRDPNFEYANNQIVFSPALDFNANAGFKLKVWSPAAGTNVTVKLEGAGVVEVSKTTSTANAWEELTFDFATSATGNTKIVLFFNLGTNTPGEFYIDDFKLYPRSGGGGGGSGDCPAPPTGELLANGGFEANNGSGSCWQFNPVGGGTVAVTTEDVNSGTYAAKLTTGTNQAPNLKMEGFATSVTGGKTIQVTFKYKFTTALGEGSILQVLAFSEKAPAGATLHELANANGTPLNTWNTYTQTFVTDPGITQGLSLLIQLTGSGNAGAAGVVFIDDVKVTQL